jgi:hypothetical protein
MNRSSLPCAAAALLLAAFSLGCASSPSARYARNCPDCQVVVRDTLPLPVSNDQVIVRLDQSWQVLEHSCPRCNGETTAFFRGGRFEDPCPLDPSRESRSSVRESGSGAPELALADGRAPQR